MKREYLDAALRRLLEETGDLGATVVLWRDDGEEKLVNSWLRELGAEILNRRRRQVVEAFADLARQRIIPDQQKLTTEEAVAEAVRLCRDCKFAPGDAIVEVLPRWEGFERWEGEGDPPPWAPNDGMAARIWEACLPYRSEEE